MARRRFSLLPPRPVLLLSAAAVLLPGGALPAQDVEMLGRVYGTRVPRGYYDELRRDPEAFRFRRALMWMARRGLPLSPGEEGGGAPPRGAAATPAVGTVRVPIVMGLYDDSGSPPVEAAAMQREWFDGPSSYYRTLTEYYEEVSGGRVHVTGDVYEWVRVSLSRAQVVGSSKGLNRSDARVGEFIVRVLSFLTDSVGVDWRPYDADGDGWVDVLGVMHPDKGAECGGPGIWSHRWAIRAWMGGPFVATYPGGDTVRIDDYVVIPAVSCRASRTFNEIGVFAHELGHGFGLPDLYDTEDSDGQHAGVGVWDLMATGNWGCSYPQAFEPERPCHLGAWSKGVLGWAAVETLAGGTDHGKVVLEGVEASGRVLRVDAQDGSNDYYLLEHRSPVGFDAHLFAPGLLIWRVDQEVVSARWGSNRVNTDPSRLGVGLVQADGLGQLQRTPEQGGNRGDAGDPFPGDSGRTAFHAGSVPASLSHRGAATGVTLLEIGEEGPGMAFRLLTRFQTLRIVVEGTSGATMTVGGVVGQAAPELSLPWAPFESRTVEAAPGSEVAPGVRDAFVGWADGAPRVRTVRVELRDTTLVALYGDREYLLALDVHGPHPSIVPGTVSVDPPGAEGRWFRAGSEVTVRADPVTGFAFREWTGDLAGAPNPAALVVDTALSGAAEFDLVYGIVPVGDTVSFPAAEPREIVFRAENANEPVTWRLASGRLPEGMSLRAGGVLEGAALETGTFPVTVRATDAIGLTAEAAVTLAVRTPTIGTGALAGPFLLTGESPTLPQQRYLDRVGNRNGRYDLGDLRAYLVANPNLPAAVRAGAPVRTLLPPVRFPERRRP